MFKQPGSVAIIGMCLALFLLAGGSFVHAHPLSLSKARIDVRPDMIIVRISVFCEDYFLYHGLEPDDQNRLRPQDISRATDAHRQFLLDYVSLLDKDGRRLETGITRVEPFAIPADGVSVDDMTQYTTTYELSCPLPQRPEFLTFVQNLGGDDSFVPALMDVSIWRDGVEVDHHSQLEKGQAYTRRFDWNSPPIPLDADTLQRREQERRLQEATMGISSYATLYSFIYIERFEVRHEILVPLLTLETFLPIKRADRQWFEVEEQDAAREAIGKLFSTRNAVQMDGVRVTPTVSRIDFYGVDFKDFAMLAPRKRLSIMNARVGIILSYATKGSLGQLTMDWSMFTPQTTVVRSVVLTDAGADKFVFSRYRSQFRWENPGGTPLPPLTAVACPPPAPPLSFPWLSLLAAGVLVLTGILGLRRPGALRRRAVVAAMLLAATAIAAWKPARVQLNNPLAPPPALTDEQAAAVFTAVHKNIYRAFDYRDESDIYDALAHSVGGDLLTRLYLVIHQGRLMAEQGGAVSRIQDVQILDGNKQRVYRTGQNEAAFSYRARWRVLGTVEHWGHVHERTHEYEARFEVQAHDEAWRITEFEVLDEQRLSYRTRLRSL